MRRYTPALVLLALNNQIGHLRVQVNIFVWVLLVFSNQIVGQSHWSNGGHRHDDMVKTAAEMRVESHTQRQQTPQNLAFYATLTRKM